MSNNTERELLLKLYELLWEQIKDESVFMLTKCVWRLENKLIITPKEANILAEHLVKHMPQMLGTSDNRKSFVQQQIEKLKNKE